MREADPLDIVETIREGLLVLEPDLTIRFANRAYCDKCACGLSASMRSLASVSACCCKS